MEDFGKFRHTVLFRKHDSISRLCTSTFQRKVLFFLISIIALSPNACIFHGRDDSNQNWRKKKNESSKLITDIFLLCKSRVYGNRTSHVIPTKIEEKKTSNPQN